MNNLVWKRVKPLVEKDSINKFQEIYGIVFPEELKELIKANNGGRPSLDIIKTVEGEELEVKALLSFNKEDVENIYNVINYFKEHFQGRIVPIATEPSGNYFCINLTNNSIVYWNHETNKETLISNGIKEFLMSLYKANF